MATPRLVHVGIGKTLRGHLGRDIAGRQRVDADAVGRIVGGERTRQPGKTGLRRHVAGISGKAADRIDAGDVDDRSRARVLQKRMGGKDGRVDAGEVGCDRGTEARELAPGALGRQADTGGVDQRVDASALCGHGAECALDGLVIREIAGNRAHAPWCGPGTAEAEHRSARILQAGRDRSANTAGGAGDDRDLAGEREGAEVRHIRNYA